MFNFFIIMDEIQGNNIARNFSSEYFNYTINFIISKEFPSFSDFPDFSLVLCDLDQNIELAKKYEEIMEKLKDERTVKVPFKWLYDIRQYDKCMDGCYMEITKIA